MMKRGDDYHIKIMIIINLEIYSIIIILNDQYMIYINKNLNIF